MKKTRMIIALLLVVMLAVSMPMSALAASWDAQTSADVENAFVNDTDAEVIINMKNDIVMEAGVTANEGQNYTINGNGSTISDVSIGGAGSVEINADVTGSTDEYGSGNTALTVTEEANVTVNGDITGGDASGLHTSSGFGLSADNNAVVTVNGDVTSGSGTLTEEEMQVEDGYSNGGYGVAAYSNAQVTVNGDVSCGDAMGSGGFSGYGVGATDSADVTISGDVIGGNVTTDPEVDGEYSSAGGYGVYADSEATVTIEGDITAGSANSYGGYGVVAIGNASVSVGGDITAGDATGENGSGGYGAVADDNASVSAGGNVTGGDAVGENGYGGVGIDAISNAVVSVGGNVTGGDAVGENSYGGTGVLMDSTSTVTVEGSVIGGDTGASDGNGGSGVRVYYNNSESADPNAALGKLTVLGELSGGYGGENGEDGVGLFLDTYTYDEDTQFFVDNFQNLQYTLEEALAASPDEILADLSADDITTTKYWTMEAAFQFMQKNGDLTEEEVNTYFAETNKIYEEASSEEEAVLAIVTIAQQLIQDNASSMSLLELAGYEYPELELNKVSSVDSFAGTLVAEKCLEENNTYVPSATPKTGDSFNVVLVTTIAVVALMCVGATLVIRKKYC